MKTPVAFFIFNRPGPTREVFEKIRRAQPARLFVIADGPRTEQECILCEETRKIANAIDWLCEVKRNFSETNMGCGKRLSSGISWVFKQVEKAIILEDDCLPDSSFFQFCAEMLERYRDDTRIMHIAGTSAQEGNKRFNLHESYYFSIIANIWGWATWRRAWNLYDYDMKQWPALKEADKLVTWMQHPAAYARFRRVWDQYYRHEIDSWDGQWNFACLAHHGLCINPSVNLVTNIGCNEQGTHFKGATPLGNKPLQTMLFPLVHPADTIPNRVADSYKYRTIWKIDAKLRYRVLRSLKIQFPRPYELAKHVYTRIVRDR